MLPLYFPENKLEYIPAAVTCLLFIFGAVFTWRMFIKVSKREQQQFEQMEQNLKEMDNTVSDTPASK
ncbi:hypothetical protein [Ectobacillus funiculus]|uniref:Uncharacterized protein n=1 Tax=Ectobacillus funiculus TaxID=137993 RepID=A0ABV5W978_9BACI